MYKDGETPEGKNAEFVMEDMARKLIATQPERDYDVSICRTGYGHRVDTIRAHHQEEAERIAINKAGGFVYSEHHSEYSIEDVTEAER